MKVLGILFCGLVVISTVATYHHSHRYEYAQRAVGDRLYGSPFQFDGSLSNQYRASRQFQGGKGGQRNQAPQDTVGKKFMKTEITPEIEQLVRKGLKMVDYDPKDVQLQAVKTQAGGRNMNTYRVSYSNPVQNNQYCYFQFRYSFSRLIPSKPVCSSPCPRGVCRVNRHLRNISSYDSSYNKDWSDRHFHEDRQVHSRNYAGADFMDDVNNYG